MLRVNGNYLPNVRLETKIFEDVLGFFKEQNWEGWRCRVRKQPLAVHVDLHECYVNIDSDFLEHSNYFEAQQQIQETLFLHGTNCQLTFHKPDGTAFVYENHRKLPKDWSRLMNMFLLAEEQEVVAGEGNEEEENDDLEPPYELMGR